MANFFGNWSRLFNHQNEPPEPAFQSFRTADAYHCENCHFTSEGHYRGTCQRCRGTHIISIAQVMTKMRTDAQERLQAAAQPRGRFIRGLAGGQPKAQKATVHTHPLTPDGPKPAA